MKRISLFFLPFIFVGMILLIGCGKNISGSGTVTYSSGEPVPSGMIFFSTPQFNYTGTINNGFFELGGLQAKDGLPSGKYQVHFIGTIPVEGTSDDIPLFASKYNAPETSGIVVEVKRGKKNFFEFVVEKPVTNQEAKRE
jgi:hypothetical protein